MPTPTPVPTGEPTAATTGAKGTLTAYTGPMTISVAGTVIDSKTITGMLLVRAANVTVKNCRINGNDYWGIDAEGSSGLTVTDCTFAGANSGNSAILSGTNCKLIARCDIRGWENGITLQDGSAQVIGNYIHDLLAGPDGHYDGISVQGGQKGVLIKGNTVYSYDTSCVFIKADFGPIDDVTVDGNWLLNQAGKQTAAPVYAYGMPSKPATNIKITNNVLEKGWNGDYLLTQDCTPVFTGNTDAKTGAKV